MALSSLLYISRSTIPPSEAEIGLSRIVATAVARNSTLGLTGALLFTSTHFAQVLEGDEIAIDALMAKVTADSRHDQISIVDKGTLVKRRFASWSMAYYGPSQFVSRHVTRLLNDPLPPERRRAAEWLTELMVEFEVHPAAVA